MQELVTAGAASAVAPASSPRNRLAVAAWFPEMVVAAVWLAMLVGEFTLIHLYGRNVPYQDDWELVPELTGQNPVTLKWLFAQHNEHRIPLPRLLLLGLFKISGLDFRAGMYFNALALGLLALAMMAALRSVRGRSGYFDAFFPLMLMGWGHWQNLLWSWQIQYVCSTVLAGIILLVMVVRGNRLTSAAALTAGVCLLALPLCGANGVALVPVLALWLGWCGVRAWRTDPAGQTLGALMIAFAALALVGVALYWVGYQPVERVIRRETDVRLASALAFVGLGFGSSTAPGWLVVLLRETILPVAGFAVARWWLRRPLRPADVLTLVVGLLLVRGLLYECQYLELRPSLPSAQSAWGMVALAATVMAVVVLGVAAHRQPGERLRIFGLLCFALAFGGFALAIGAARAGVVGNAHYVARYLTLAILLPCWVAFAFELYAPRDVIRFTRPVLLTLAVALVVASVPEAQREGRAQAADTDFFLSDLHAGLPPSEIAARQADGRFGVFSRSREPYLVGCILLLRDAGHPEFRNVPDETAAPGRRR